MESRPRELSKLRGQLRELGYLDSRLERFFLEDAGQPRRARLARAIVANAAKLGLTAGPLVGALVWGGQLLRGAELTVAPLDVLDVLVLGVYILLAASLAIALLGLGAGCSLLLARTTGLLKRLPIEYWARGLGLTLGGAILGYLTLWWQERWEASPATIAALFLGAWIAFLVARVGTLAAVGVLVAVAPDRSPSIPALSRHRTVRYALAGALVYAVLFAAAQGSSGPPVLTASPYELQEPRYRIRVVGIDGLPLDWIHRFRDNGVLPGFDRLAESAAMAELSLVDERVPTVIWTSLATGQDPRGHGIRAMRADAFFGLSTPFQLGERSTLVRVLAAFRLSESRPVDTALRRAKTVWDILSDQGRPIGVTGWWASWPAEPLRGYLLTDRLFFKLAQSGPFEKETDSVELFHRLSGEFEGERRRAIETLTELHPRAVAMSGPELALALERDAYHISVAELLEKEAPPELQMLYLSGLDIASMKLLVSGEESLDETVAAVQFLQSYLVWLDSWVGRWVERAGPEEVLILVAEPGRGADPETSRGAIFLAGGPFKAGLAVPSSTVYDIAPTVLHLLGFPVSSEMAGQVLEAAFDPAMDMEPIREIQTFGSKRLVLEGSGTMDSDFDQEMIRQLRSLGYIE